MWPNHSENHDSTLKRQRGRILIIDDDPDTLLVLQHMLTPAGYDVFLAETGSAGVKTAIEQQIDVVLLDMNLPDGSGLDFCMQIKNNKESGWCQVLFLSGLKTSHLDQAQGLRAGADGYMTKPITEEQLLARIETAMRIKRSEDALRFERAQLLSIFNSIDESIYIIDPLTYEILFANKAMCDMFQKELVGEICYRAIQDKDSPCDFCTNHIILKNKGVPYQWEHYNPILNMHLLITDKIIKWPDGRDVRFEFAIDITRRKQAEEALKKSEERFKLAMDATRDGLWDWDVNTGEAYFSPGYTAMLGYSPDAVVPGFSFWQDRLHPDDREKALLPITDCVENRTRFFEVEFRMKTSSNEWRWILGRGNAVTRDETGRATRMIGTHTDITERKMAEEKILEANKKLKKLTRKANELAMEARAASQSKSEFLANMSHEIRTPLNGIIGMTNLLLDTELNQEQLTIARHIDYSGEVLLDLINDILDFSKIEAGRLELESLDFSLRDLLENIVTLMEHQTREKQLKLVNIVDRDVPEHLAGDPGRLRQVLVNLINNAIKFTSKGSIEVHTSLVSSNSEELELLFSVKDTGIGIPEDKLDVLFDKFYQVDSSTTRKYGGTGLGLAIARQLVTMMGGEIGAQSTEGRGSEFWFTARLKHALKPVKDEKPESKTAKKTGHPRFNGHVLVVEDTPVNQKVAAGILKKLGLTADVASNGIEAVKALESCTYDLILMDVHMPEMDGLEATRHIRKLESGQSSNNDPIPPQPSWHVPIIAMTAGAMKQDREKCFEAGMDDYIAKPVNREAFEKMLDRWLGSNKANQEERTIPLLGRDQQKTTENDYPVSTGEDHALPVFDRNSLLNRFGNDLDFAREILKTYLEYTPANMESLKNSLEIADFQKAFKEAHSIKGNSSNVGCLALAEAAKRMENAVRSENTAGMQDILAEMQREFEMCSAQIMTAMKNKSYQENFYDRRED